MYLSWFWIIILAIIIWQMGFNSGKINGRNELRDELEERNINIDDYDD